MMGSFTKELGRVRGQVSVAVGMGAALIIIGTFMFKRLMDLTWEEAFYFSVVTLTTVGYGDVTPETGFQRVVVALYVLIGVTIFVTAISIIGVNVIEKRQARLAEKVAGRNEALHARIHELEEKLEKLKNERGSAKGPTEPTTEKEVS